MLLHHVILNLVISLGVVSVAEIKISLFFLREAQRIYRALYVEAYRYKNFYMTNPSVCVAGGRSFSLFQLLREVSVEYSRYREFASNCKKQLSETTGKACAMQCV